MNLLRTNLAPVILEKFVKTFVPSQQLMGTGVPSPGPRNGEVMTWVVFLLCLIFSAAGVAFSVIFFASKITGLRLWGVGFVISIVMLGISYGAKYASPEARQIFTPVDLIQYLSQGFLWPSTWPALAELLGIKPIAGPQISALFDRIHALFAAILAWHF